MSHQVIIALEGFTLPSGFIVKELTILSDNLKYQHFHFNKPKDFYPTAGDLRTIKYTSEVLSQLYFDDDSLLPYSTINDILKQMSSHKIYVAGHTAHKFITTYLPTTEVINLCKEYKFKYPLILPSVECFKQHTPRYCSLAKAKRIKSLRIWKTNDFEDFLCDVIWYKACVV